MPLKKTHRLTPGALVSPTGRNVDSARVTSKADKAGGVGRPRPCISRLGKLEFN